MITSDAGVRLPLSSSDVLSTAGSLCSESTTE